MLKSISDVPFDPITEGVISENILSHYVSPKGAISYAENFHNDILGIMTTRRMLTTTGTAPAARVLGCVLYQEASLNSTPNIVWQEGTTLKFQDILGTGGVTTRAATFGASNKSRYDIVQGYLLMTNSGSGQPKYTNAVATVPAALGTSFPTGVNLISAGFSGRIWASDSSDALNRVYYSDVIPAAGITAPVTGGASFLTINANNGDKVTGFARLQNVLYVFTHNGIFRVYNTQSQDNTSLSQVGCFNQEAIVKAKNGFYFVHPSGVYYLGSNGFPQEVSGKIRDIIQKIPNANQGSIFGWSDDDHVYFNIGLVPAMSSTKQYIIRYTISTQIWTTYALSSNSGSLTPTCAAYENFASTNITSDDIYPTNFIFADDTVNFYKGTFNVFLPATMNSVVTNDFNAFPIFAEFHTPWMIFDNETHVKRINGMSIPSENAAGFKFAYQTDKDMPNIWHEIGEFTANYMTLFPAFQTDKFNRIKFRVYGETKGVTVKVGIPMIRKLDDLGYEYN
jgi:hypothetical protein